MFLNESKNERQLSRGKKICMYIYIYLYIQISHARTRVCVCVSGCLKKLLGYRVLNTRTCESNEFSMRAVKCVSSDRLHG